MNSQNKATEIEFLVGLANQAKNVGCFEIANIVFAIILENIQELEMSLQLENRDTKDRSLENKYYDLAVLAATGQTEWTLNIPAPMLNEITRSNFEKSATLIKGYGQHNRSHRRPMKGEIQGLWIKIFSHTPDCAIRVLVSKTFTHKVSVWIIAALNKMVSIARPPLNNTLGEALAVIATH